MFTADPAHPNDGPSLVGARFTYHGRYAEHDGETVRVRQRDYLTDGWLVEAPDGGAWAMSRASIEASGT